MRYLVTGAAGFIGSRLALRLLQEGFPVIGIDGFIDYYPRDMKERNLAPLKSFSGFEFREGNLNDLDVASLLRKVDGVFHLAAQAGVRASWGDSFSIYTRNNIDATQKLLEAARRIDLKRFVYASSSSVYGLTPDLPMKETSPLLPYSPYGVSKLAGEHLCSLYSANYGVPAVSLRFFTVYGPGQRPDMAFHRFFKAILEDRPITVFGDGRQTRDFTYIDDIIDANLAAMERGTEGGVYNTGGGNRRMLSDIFPLLEAVCGRPVRIDRIERQKGDVRHTYADISRAQNDLGFKPKIFLEDGLPEQWRWIQSIYA
jgi:nucleoside-diphosphate-sugar epimerase